MYAILYYYWVMVGKHNNTLLLRNWDYHLCWYFWLGSKERRTNDRVNDIVITSSFDNISTNLTNNFLINCQGFFIVTYTNMRKWWVLLVDINYIYHFSFPFSFFQGKKSLWVWLQISYSLSLPRIYSRPSTRNIISKFLKRPVSKTGQTSVFGLIVLTPEVLAYCRQKLKTFRYITFSP